MSKSTQKKLKEKKMRGRPKEKYLNGLTKWHMKRVPTKVIKSAQDHTEWKSKIVSVA